jgi:2-succinyl-6-hydroxy-2,4-cyclohexadiene-1-carboxylate synthase
MIWALHGALGLAADWSPLQEKGMCLRRVSLWEDVAPYGEWAPRFCERVYGEDDGASIMGYSMGGRLALHALLERPSMWRSAVIVSAHPGLASEEERAERVASDGEWARRIREESPEGVLADWEGQAVLAGSVGGRDAGVLGRWRGEMAESMERWSLGRQENLRERLAAISCPVLWVTGGEDEKFESLAREAVALLPRGEHVVVEGVGHRVPWEAQDAFARIVIGFQNRVRMAAGAGG